MNEQRNLLLLVNDPNGLVTTLAQGYKVLLCTEDQLPPTITISPNLLKMSILLPPYEAVSYESDNMLDAAFAKYAEYLSNYQPAVTTIDTIYLSALLNNPIAIYLGSESNDLKLMSYLITYLQCNMGLAFSRYACGAIETSNAPNVIYRMYMGGEINAMVALSMYPVDMDFTAPDMLDRLFVELRPPIPMGDYAAYNEYFKNFVKQLNGTATNSYGQQLYCPIVGGGENGDR